VKSVSLMHLNGGYVRHGDLDLNALFTVEDCTAEVMAMVGQVPANAAEIRRVMAQESEPLAEIGPHCGKPHECGYRRWCQRHVPTPSVYDLKRMGFARAMRLEEQGIVTLPEALDAGVLKSRRQIVQAECVAQDLDEIVDRDEIAHFLDALSFPLCFLDFETWNPAIPPFDGTHPYQQLTTQYSLHVLESPAGPLTHHEFLARCGSDPRRQVAEHLVADVPAGACTLAYSKGFEVARIRELARAFPDLARPLTDICDNMADLLVPFDRGWYHNRAIGGSDSLKSVVPALFAGDADLDYHALEGVHNGSEATDAYARLADMSPEEAARTREQLLRYCELDTYALVKIVQRLADLTGRWPEMRGLGAESVEHVPTQVQPADAPAAANAGTTSPERDEGPATPSRLRSLLGRIFHSR
jgi:hypothetical protein